MSKNKKIVIIASIAFGICGCAAGFLFFGLRTLPLGAVDCGWVDTALAWVDENQNGVWDNSEKPLAKVQFVADDIKHDYDTGGDAISNESGEAGLYVFPVDCNGFDETEITIKAIPPDGYEPTTPSEISVPKDAAKNAQNDNFLFGFIQKDP